MIVIPSKSDKTRSTLVDAIRLIAWTQHKSANKLQGQQAYEGYPAFESEWKAHEIHLMDLKALKKFIKDLGYTEEELLEQRSQHYQRKYEHNSHQSDLN
ncbi:hypothetical protein NG799_01705 [Laspinema sp. D1]|uniref:Type II toxin-antitoxin system HicA family toxin n=2 Tax=Laspinema TaxID=2584823 RepID=A0ABT2MNE4_9CYAN|nr:MULTISPECIES: hypothetical protein [unclassified Laspinema]MCT7965046.1 hypothetical protein [Laspinema sp. D2a]MCT7977667.1 hypothetical protein [Laspinema sp. D3b]MCT7992512.1 hypothetical protein [Laspinema sp. D3c]